MRFGRFFATLCVAKKRPKRMGFLLSV